MIPVPAPAGALKLANHHHAPTLAERIAAFLEQRIEWETQHDVDDQQVCVLLLAGCQS